MLKQFPVMIGQESAGFAVVKTDGLYYHIQAQCRLHGDVPHRLVVSAGDQTLNLGILVPEKGEFCINTKVARKKLCDSELTFRVCSNCQPKDYPLIPLNPDEPFEHLAKLSHGSLRIIGDKMYFTAATAD